MVQNVGKVGPQTLSDGTESPLRLGKDGSQVVAIGHGRFYEQASRGQLFTFGSGPTALVAVNAVGTTNATSQPVIGLWNPSTSAVNLVVLQASVIIGANTASAANPQGLYWMMSVGNSAISTGSTGFNTKTFAASSVGKAYSLGTALTGKSNANATIRASSIILTNIATAATALGAPGFPIENVDGQFVIPPGAYLGLHTGADASSNAMTVSTGILWAEVPA